MTTSPPRIARRAKRGLQPATTQTAVKRGAGIDLTSSTPSSELELPHERDEKVGMTGGVPSARFQQGARDLKRGLQDTSGAVEADTAYKKLKN